MVPACDGTIAGWRGHARLQRSIQRVCSPGCLFVLCPDDLVVAPDTADAIDVQTQRTSLGSLVHSHGRPLRSKRDHDGEGRLSRKKKEKGKKSVDRSTKRPGFAWRGFDRSATDATNYAGTDAWGFISSFEGLL